MLEKLITRFCATDGDHREYLRRPWIENGMTIATNGHLVIAVDRPLAGNIANKPSEKMAGRFAKIAAIDIQEATTVPLASIDLPKNVCYECRGSGFVIKERCGECSGEGDFSRGRWSYTCKECDGDGHLNEAGKQDAEGATGCFECNATGTGSGSQEVHGSKFQQRYLALLKLLPEAVLFVGRDPTAAARFEFEGGRGYLMPMA
jgi:hypothetical protein